MQQQPSQFPQIALALGSNLGDRLTILRAAVQALQSIFDVRKKSPVYETPPVYVTDQPAFMNAAVIGTSKLTPIKLLRAIKQTELDLGRTETFRYGPRVIDIDIIFYGDQQIVTPELELPHPRLAEREFVLRPLADIAGDWRHPAIGTTVAAMLKALPESTAHAIKESL